MSKKQQKGTARLCQVDIQTKQYFASQCAKAHQRQNEKKMSLSQTARRSIAGSK